MSEVEEIISELGSVWPMKALTRTYNSYGDATIGSTVLAVSGLWVPVSKNDEIVKLGILNMGDATFWYRPEDGSSFKGGNWITSGTEVYEIVGEGMNYQGKAGEASLKRLID